MRCRLVLLFIALATPAWAQVAELDLRTTFFLEPSADSELVVITPAAALSVTPVEGFGVTAGWEADIVTGASERVKAGPLVDVVTSATSFSDVRHVASLGFTLTRENTRLSAAGSYGIENDYRSRAISVAASTDFLQKNTQIELSYGHGFDEVCTTAFRSADSPTLRTPLDSSAGCFQKNADDRATRDVSLENFQTAWTQAWTPVFETQLVLTGAVQNGFLANPYRSMVIGPAGDEALEHHPEHRARGAAAVRGRYYVRPLATAFGLGVRVYRDTWDVFSHTWELEAERYLSSWLRILIRGRFYEQTGALFFSDDYTGGEPLLGPRGQYFTGDRELSPLHSFLLGGRLRAAWTGAPGDRVGGALLKLEASAGVDVLKTDLEEFTWSGEEPNDTIAFIPSVGLSGAF